MEQARIDILLENFFISQDELGSRILFQEFANSLASVLVDDFVQNHLLNNPHLSIYLAHTDSSRLQKNMKEFISFVLTASVNEEYVRRIYEIGAIHYSIKLEPSKVSYGFWALNEVLNKMAEINKIVKENKSLISKLLRFVEHLMNNGYYLQEEKQNQASFNELQGLNAQNELYIGLNIHKLNIEKIIQACSVKDWKTIETIEEDSNKCAFGKVLDTLILNKKYEYILGVHTQEVKNIHDRWHVEFVLLKNALSNSDVEAVQKHKQNIQSITQEIKTILDETLHQSLNDGQLAISSGVRAMKKMTALFYNKNYNEKNDAELEVLLQETIDKAFLSEFHWAIEEIVVNINNNFSMDYSIVKILRYKTKNIYLGIHLKPNDNSNYIHEIILLLLEVLDLHFSIQDREASLISFADKAESANKAKDMFLANMSHELRTPLNAITGFSQILMMKKDTPDSVKQYVQKINIAGNNLLDLVNTILDFAKLEAGKMQFSPSLSNISNILREVNTLTSQLAKNKNIQVHMPNIISLNLFIDEKLFKQVLINLLTNAIKFTPQNGTVSLNIVYDADKHMYRFEVKDNGIGLSEASIGKLFQAFSQVDNAYQKNQKGTGLGLMISKKIIESLHKGKIWVESVEGQGSSFFITMPTPMIESHTFIVDEAPSHAKHILIVEDSENYQRILTEHLRKTHKLTITDTINKAKDLLSKNTYDFLILDFFLTDGISSEILHFMEEENIHIPVIVVSAEDEIHISSSLSGSSNLEGILNKSNINEICASIRGEPFTMPLSKSK